jgi:hypothetical protein
MNELEIGVPPNKLQLQNILLSLREWLQDNKLETDWVIKLNKEDLLKLDAVIWESEVKEDLQPQFSLGFCGFVFVLKN